MCLPCDDKCSSCTGPLNTECQTCSDGNFLLGSVCNSSCPENYYPDDVAHKCNNCFLGCKSCVDASNLACDDCRDNFFMINNTCMSDCPDKFYKDAGNTCTSCY